MAANFDRIRLPSFKLDFDGPPEEDDEELQALRALAKLGEPNDPWDHETTKALLEQLRALAMNNIISKSTFMKECSKLGR